MDIDLTGYTLTFSDEFNQLSLAQSSPKGLAKWLSYPPYGPSGAFSDSTWNAQSLNTNNGILVNRAFWDPAKNRWQTGFISSVDETKAGFSQQYGYFSIRAKMPNAGQGAWPAFWLMGTANIPNNTGQRLEIDIFEWYGNNQSQQAHALHCWNSDGSHGPGTASTWGNVPGGDAINTWHIYGCLVKPDFITWFIDGIQTFKTPTPKDYHNSPLYIMINYGMGSGWALTGSPYDVKGESFMLVDWVRVYSLPGEPVADMIKYYPAKVQFGDEHMLWGTFGGSSSISGPWTPFHQISWTTYAKQGWNIVVLPAGTLAKYKFLIYQARSFWDSAFGHVAEIEFWQNGTKVAGKPFSSVPSVGHEADKAFDGNVDTYFEGQVPNSQYVGIEKPSVNLTVKSTQRLLGGSKVTLYAPDAPSGYKFDRWIGDTLILLNPLEPTTVAIVPMLIDVTVEAQYISNNL